MLTRSQRNKLEALSEKLYGNTNAYKKIAKNRIADGPRVDTGRAYVQLRNGTVMGFDAAVARGLVRAEDLPKFQTFAQGSREPSYDEMVEAMEQVLESQDYAKLSERNKMIVAAHRLVANSTRIVPWLVVEETKRHDYDGMVALLPEDVQKRLLDRVVPNRNAKEFCVDGFGYVAEAVFALEHKDEAARIYELALQNKDGVVA